MVMQFIGNLIDKFNSTQPSKQDEATQTAQDALALVHKTTIDLLNSRLARLAKEFKTLERAKVHAHSSATDIKTIGTLRGDYDQIIAAVEAQNHLSQTPEETIIFLQDSADLLEKFCETLREMPSAPLIPPSASADPAPVNQTANAATRREKLDSTRQSQGLQDSTTLVAPKLRFKKKSAPAKPTA